MTWRTIFALLVLLLALIGIAYADEPGPNSDPVAVSVQGGVLATLSDGGSALTPTATIAADGPLAVGSAALGRVHAELALSSLPGESVDLGDPATFRSADVRLAVGRIVGHLRNDGPWGQDITTEVLALAGFGTRLPADPGPEERLVRRSGVGVRVAERLTGDFLEVAYGQDEAAGDWGYGQVMVRGRVTVPATAGVAQLVGDAVISVGRPEGRTQRDVLRVGVVASASRIMELVR